MNEVDSVPRAKDGWDKADIVLKGVLAVLLPTAIAFFGIYTELKRADQSEENRTYQTLVQTLSSREAVGADLKSKMFTTLMEHYFAGPEPKKIAVLELMAINFDEQFRLRPLFETLSSELSDPSDQRELKRVVANLVRKEVAEIRAAGGQTCVLSLALGNRVSAACAPVSLTLSEVQEDHIRVSQVAPVEAPFDISYFDMPLTDNTTLGELKYSLVLVSTDTVNGAASVELVIFPRHSYSLQSRLAFDQLVGEYLAPSVKFSAPNGR
jgi:hypothetical protein